MLKLFVLRHGKAKTPDLKTPDFSRVLSRKGTAQVNQVGYILKEQNVQIDQIISSGAYRTTQTAEIINFYLNVPTVAFDDNLYLTDREAIQKSLEQNANSNSLMYVGHNTGISNFVNHITHKHLSMSTSMLIEIDFEMETWDQLGTKVGIIKQIIEPEVQAF